jgi:hypothetical protein
MEQADAPRTEPFIALASDFATFESWPSVEVEPFDIAGGHRVGPTRVYLDGDLPPEGERFAVGTILIKTVEDGPPETWEVHAMAKRGGEYNIGGAVGWEYFDIVLTAEGEPLINWRGEGDPGDPGNYVNDAGEIIACNDCHLFATSRDHVFSLPVLRAAL